MMFIQNLKIRTKLAALSVVAITAITIVAATLTFQARENMLEDRISKIRSITETAIGIADQLWTRTLKLESSFC